MLDGNTLKQIRIQLEDALDNFVTDSLCRVKIDIDTHEFIIFTISIFDAKGNIITLNLLKRYLHDAEIPYTQPWTNEVKLSEDDTVKLLALLRLEGY